MIPCSRNMISVTSHVLRYLRRDDGSVEQIAEAGETTVHNVRRAINALREVLPIDYTRYAADGERVDLWALGVELDEGEPEAIAAAMFMEPADARRLLARARVADVVLPK